MKFVLTNHGTLLNLRFVKSIQHSEPKAITFFIDQDYANTYKKTYPSEEETALCFEKLVHALANIVS